jgi:selenocysteine lyase/cysteine desulfurase
MLMTNGIFRGPAGLNGVSGYISIWVEGAFTQFPDWKSRTGFRRRRTDAATSGVSYPIARYPTDRTRILAITHMSNVLGTVIMEHHSNIVPWNFLRERQGAIIRSTAARIH